MLPVPGPARGSPRQMERSQRRAIEERRSQRQASPWNHPLPCYKNRVGDGGSPDPERWEGRLNHSFRLSRESAAKQNRVGDGCSPGPGRWEGRLNHCSRPQNKSRRDDAAVPAMSSRTPFARCSNFLLSQKRSW